MPRAIKRTVLSNNTNTNKPIKTTDERLAEEVFNDLQQIYKERNPNITDDEIKEIFDNSSFSKLIKKNYNFCYKWHENKVVKNHNDMHWAKDILREKDKRDRKKLKESECEDFE